MCLKAQAASPFTVFKIKVYKAPPRQGASKKQIPWEIAKQFPSYLYELVQIYRMLQEERVDLALNDQRRAFSDAFVNLILTTADSLVEVSSHSPLAALKEIEPGELKNLPCILVASKEQQEMERKYCWYIVCFLAGLCAGTLGGGFVRIPLVRRGEKITRNYCAFWKKDNSGYYVEEFAAFLQNEFE